MRARMLGTLACGLLIVSSSGCGWFEGPQSAGGLAVVDLDEVARQVGADGEIAQALQTREASLNSQLQVMKANYVQQLKDRKELYGENPTEAQSQQLVSINRQINMNLISAQQKATSHLTSHRSELILKFRGQVGPIAEQIAKQRGLSIVVPKNDGWLLAVDESVDITNDVAEALKPNWKPIVLPSAAPAPTTDSPRIAAEGMENTRDTHNFSNPAESGTGVVQPAGHFENAPLNAPPTP